MNQPINQIKDINKQFTKGTHLFNGILKDKFKFKYNPINDGVLKEIANKYKKGDKRPSYDDYEPDPACIPMPTDLLRHELDKDDMMMDTIIDLCDSDGIPLRWRYLCDDFDARDWVGCPIKKYEIDAIEKKRKIYERRAIKKKQEYLKRRVKAKKLHEESKKIKIKN